MAEKKIVNNADFFKGELKSGLSGAYFFYGDEDYMKQYYLHEAENSITGGRDSMNFIRLTNDEFTPGTLEEALSSVSVGDFWSLAEESSDKRLIELYEVDFKALKPTDFTAVCKLIKEKSDQDNIVIIYSTSAELPSDSKPHQAIIKELSKCTQAVEFKPESDAKLCSWIVKMAAKQKAELSPDDARYILERVGHQMLMLKNETDKVCAYVLSQGQSKITRADIDKIICTNKEISPFDFANALMRRDSKTAFYILEDMKLRGEEPIIILSTVSRVLNELISVKGYLDKGMTRDEIAAKTKMHTYRVKLYSESLKNIEISKLFKTAKAAADADLLLKSSPIDSYTVIERLICTLTYIK